MSSARRFPFLSLLSSFSTTLPASSLSTLFPPSVSPSLCLPTLLVFPHPLLPPPYFSPDHFQAGFLKDRLASSLLQIMLSFYNRLLTYNTSS